MSRIHFNKGSHVFFVVCVLLIISISAAFGFLISSDGAANKFTVGNNTSHIEESFGSYDSFSAGQTYEKKVAVKNDGSVDCYVRVFAEIEDPEVAAKIGIDFNTSAWTEKQADGYYYYKKQLAEDEITEPLFTTITAKEDITEFQMICCSETVQADGADSPFNAFKK